MSKSAVNTFPKEVVSIVSSISSHFARKTQRVACLDEVQRENKIGPYLGVISYHLLDGFLFMKPLKESLTFGQVC